LQNGPLTKSVYAAQQLRSRSAEATGRANPAERGAAAHGADFIRTHELAALGDGLAVMAALATESGSARRWRWDAISNCGCAPSGYSPF
jgi:hypothetical protein